MRKLKYHEQKLLKKVDFINWEADNNLHEVKILKKYHIQKREDYTAYVNAFRLFSVIIKVAILVIYLFTYFLVTHKNWCWIKCETQRWKES